MRSVSKTTAKIVLLALAITLIATASAFAGDDGQGWYGDINDKIVTFFGFGLIILFPLIAAIGSFIQGRLQRRTDERKSAIFKHGK